MGKFDGILILTDLDGTLLDSQAQVSEENQQAIVYFTENGGRFSIATGRSKAGMEHFIPQLHMNAPAVIYNGAAVYDFAAQQAVQCWHVGEPGYRLAKSVHDTFADVGIEVYQLHQPYIGRMNAITQRHFSYVKMPVLERELEEIPQPWLNLLFTRDASCIAEVEQFIEEQFPGQFFFQYSSDRFLEVLSPLTNKGVASLRLAEAVGVAPENLYTVGDGKNDIQLLTCTRNGFAPANACQQVLDLGLTVLPDNDHHCIRALIRHIEEKLEERGV